MDAALQVDQWADVEEAEETPPPRVPGLGMTVIGGGDARLSPDALDWLRSRGGMARIQWDCTSGAVSLLPGSGMYVVRHDGLLYVRRLERLRLVKKGDTISLRPTVDALGRDRLLLVGVKRPLR
jgi:hypothetical protein